MELLTTTDAWRYFVAPIDSPSSDFGPFETVVDRWREKAGPGLLPAWRSFELMDFEGWWGWLTVIDLLSDDATDHRYRLWGSNLARVFGMEMTGRRMADEWGGPSDARHYSSGDIELLRAVAGTPCIGVASGPIDGRFPTIHAMTTVRMPMADDGQIVTRVLSAVVLREEDDPWPPR